MTAPRRRAARSRRRHPSDGGYARGARTRLRIIERAIEMFAAAGYERTSTRAIARRARVSLPALQYYFGGKPGLHRACAEHIQADMRARLEPAFAAARAALAQRLDRAALLEQLRKVLDPFLEGMAADRPESWVLFFTRAQYEHGAVFEALFQQVGGGMVTLYSEIIGRLLKLPPGSPEVLIRALSVAGHAVLLRRGRPMMLRALGWPDFEGERLQLLKRVIWRHIEASLG
jgi:TetR/AcrR family transcriptional regulator, regulator of cefoperazone and chloramphenicol sensitivity